MSIRGGCDGHATLVGQPKDRFVRILFTNFLAPSSRAGFDGQAVTLNKLQNRAEQARRIIGFRVKVMYFHQIEMSEAIDAAALDQPLELGNIFGEGATRTSACDLASLIGPIEHFAFTGEVVDRSQDEIELLPVPLDPPAAGRRGDRVIIQFDSDENFNILVLLSQTLDDFKVNAGVVAIMIGEGDTPNLSLAGSMNPGLQKLQCIRADLMPLRMSVIIAGKHSRNQSYAMPTLKRATAAAQFSFCWTN